MVAHLNYTDTKNSIGPCDFGGNCPDKLRHTRSVDYSAELITGIIFGSMLTCLRCFAYEYRSWPQMNLGVPKYCAISTIISTSCFVQTI